MSDSPLGLTPREIVERLDQYIVGQSDAKKLVAIALRNRARRMVTNEDIRDEITPKNIIMIGPTGVGKTEISRRLSRLVGAPFIKVEASKFTEVGYVGRDVESMVRELLDIAINMTREERVAKVEEKLEDRVRERLLDVLEARQGRPLSGAGANVIHVAPDGDASVDAIPGRDELARQLDDGELDDELVEIEVKRPSVNALMTGMPGQPNMEEMGVDLQGMLNQIMPPKSAQSRMSVAEARSALQEQEAETLIDQEAVTREAIERVEEKGIIFIDEIDKIAGRGGGAQGPDVSREGVQRDILPIIEGTTVFTKHGPVNTDHVLFIAAGAFHVSKPSDLIPELQGRFPLRVELRDLTADDFERILTEPTNALTRQYVALMATEDVTIKFTPRGVRAIADAAYEVNQRTENIGARRLYTILERIMEEVAFEAPSMTGVEVKVNDAFVDERLKDIIEDQDLSKFIL